MAIVRQVGKSQAFGSKADIGSACVGERPHVGTDAVVVRWPRFGHERKCSTRGRTWRIDGVRPLRKNLGDHRLGERCVAHLARQPHHRCLLSNFASAAHNGERRRRAQSAQERRHLAADDVCECSIRWIVKIGHHRVLPDENAHLIASPVEFRRLVQHRAAQAQHVQAGALHQAEVSEVVGIRRLQIDDIDRGPARAAAEDPHVVHKDRKSVAIRSPVESDFAKARLPEIDMDVADLDVDRM